MAVLSEGLLEPVPQGPSGRGIGRLVPYLFASALVFSVLLWTGLGRESADVSALLSDPDDFMRLVQVIDWLDGQGWTDMVQRRLNPPSGVAMHWSRLADIPVAAVIWLAEPWFGRAGAVYLSALLVPPFLGGLFTALFLWAALPLLSARLVLVPFSMVGTLLYPLALFRPGRVDHHGLQLALTVLAIGLLLRALESGRARAAVGLGVVGGTSLAIGLETLPFLGTVTMILSLMWTWRGGKAATSLTIFGLTMTGTALVLLFLTLPRSDWTACDRMSFAHVALTAVVPAAGLGALALERLRSGVARPARLAIVGGIGIAGLGLTAAVFPHCTGSPYATLPAEAHYWFEMVIETQSLLELFHDEPGRAVSTVILPLAALVSLVGQSIAATDRAGPRRIALLALVLSSLTVLAWQVRGVSSAGLAASLALIPLADSMNARADRIALSNLKQIVVRLGWRFCVPGACILATLLPPLLLNPASSPTPEGQESECDVSARAVRSVFAALSDPAGLGSETRTIAAPIDIGPRILFLTRHRVLAAPYHRNTQGLSDNRRIFAGTEADALATVRARDVEAILFCRKFVPVTTYAGQPAFLNERLGAGRPPWWLVPMTPSEDMSLYQVHPAVRAVR